MARHVILCFLLLLTAFGPRVAEAQQENPPSPEVMRVPLTAWLAARPHVSADSLPDMGFDPISRERYAEVLRFVLKKDWASAAPLAGRIGYEIVILENGDRHYTVLQEDRSRGIGPTVVIAHQPRRNVIAEAPHASFEPGTSEEAATLLGELGFRAAIISGAHRCAAGTFVKCRGHTTVCGDRPGSPYRTSDTAHNPATLFHVAHLTLIDAWPQVRAISLHGMRKRGDTIAVISDGSHAMDGPKQSTVLAIRDEFRRLIGQGDGGVYSCNHSDDADTGFPRLCGTTNIQGIALNGPTAVCGLSTDQSSGRFVHIEQTWNILGEFQRRWADLDGTKNASALVEAMGTAFQEDMK